MTGTVKASDNNNVLSIDYDVTVVWENDSDIGNDFQTKGMRDRFLNQQVKK